MFMVALWSTAIALGVVCAPFVVERVFRKKFEDAGFDVMFPSRY